ncbi:MAG TPA: hypothetical protein VED43_12930, partial [Mycobacterium sp.]|nr:hypothetical protein [Mycobacterium sp.]
MRFQGPDFRAFDDNRDDNRDFFDDNRPDDSSPTCSNRRSPPLWVGTGEKTAGCTADCIGTKLAGQTAIRGISAEERTKDEHAIPISHGCVE